MSLNARLMGRILSVQKILVGGIEQTPEGAVTDGKVTQYMLIRGSTGNDAIVDSNGNLVCMLKGSENLPIAQDASGNMVAVVKGSEDLIIAQDTSGNMIAAMKGLEGANVRDIAVDENGNMVTLMKGDDGTNLQTIKVDATGQMYVAMTGQSLSVDNQPSDYFKASEYPSDYAKNTDIPSDYFKADESAVMKGDDAGTKRLVAVDTAGIMLSRMKGAYGAVLKDILLDDTGIMLSRMKGSFGGALKDIGVDTNGNMISVMKGNYGGALKTWKVDTDGRGEMILNDPTDVWGTVNPMGFGEAAVRSHAPPMVHDKRGNIVRWVDFKSATPNYSVGVSGTPTHSRSTDTAFNGDHSYKCILAQYDQVNITQSTNDYSEANMRGASVMFASADSDFTIYLEVRSWDPNNNAYKWVKLQFNSSTGNITIYNDLDSYVIDTVNYYSDIYNFSTLKLVTDMSGQKYTRATVFGKEYDLSAYSTGLSLTSGTQRLDTIVIVDNQAAGTNTVYLDNIILTENEPEN